MKISPKEYEAHLKIENGLKLFLYATMGTSDWVVACKEMEEGFDELVEARGETA